MSINEVGRRDEKPPLRLTMPNLGQPVTARGPRSFPWAPKPSTAIVATDIPPDGAITA